MHLQRRWIKNEYRICASKDIWSFIWVLPGGAHARLCSHLTPHSQVNKKPDMSKNSEQWITFVLISENGIRNVQEASLKTWKLKKMLLKSFYSKSPSTCLRVRRSWAFLSPESTQERMWENRRQLELSIQQPSRIHLLLTFPKSEGGILTSDSQSPSHVLHSENGQHPSSIQTRNLGEAHPSVLCLLLVPYILSLADSFAKKSTLCLHPHFTSFSRSRPFLCLSWSPAYQMESRLSF